MKQSPDSDHNTGLAVDLTHDPKNGIDCDEIFEKLKGDKRVKYLIFRGKIWSEERSEEGNRKYSGSNPHNKHLHISIVASRCNDVSPWFLWLDKLPFKTTTATRAAVARLKPLPKKKEKNETN